MGQRESGTGRRLSRREQLHRVRVLFSLWRKLRPFWGGVLMIVGATLIAILPLQFEQLLMFTAGGFTSKGLLFAILVLLCGLSALVLPELSSVVGGLGMLLSTLSLFGALGGFVIGALLAGIGGLLVFAWQPPGDVEELVREHATWAGIDPDAFQFSPDLEDE
jgi:hypothetical protein